MSSIEEIKAEQPIFYQIIYNELKSNKLKKLNKILDKISSSGIKSLNKEEKDFLNKYR